MKERADGVDFEYEMNVKDGAADTLVFLHGWGGDLSSFKGAYTYAVGNGFNAVNFAFPKIVPSEWGIYDYAAFVGKFLCEKSITRPVLIGHSFGGRVAIILASQGIAVKLVLVDSAGMKPRASLKKKFKIARYRYRVSRGKPLDGTGSIDYNNTREDQRGVFVRIVNSHLENLLAFVKCPTLIVWGKSDKDTPPYMARRLKRNIAGSRLEYLDGGHYSYIDSNYKFLRLLNTFITE
mgnify:CR=1 FL=1